MSGCDRHCRRGDINNNKYKISAPSCNETFDLPDGSYNISKIQDYIEYIIKKHEAIGEMHQY